MTFLLPLSIAILIALICEIVLWLLFRRKVLPLQFPHELDTSYFRFLTMKRMEMVAIMHAVWLCVCLGLLIWYLW